MFFFVPKGKPEGDGRERADEARGEKGNNPRFHDDSDSRFLPPVPSPAAVPRHDDRTRICLCSSAGT